MKAIGQPFPSRRHALLDPRNRIASILVSLVAATLVLCGWVFLFGGVQGREMNVDTLRRQSFRYFQLPGLDWQLTPATIQPQDDPLADYLNTKNLISAPSSASPRWDVTAIRRGSDFQQGPAAILARYLDAEGTGSRPSWLAWSMANPDLSAQLWPLIQLAAQYQAYTLVPELFARARQFESNTESDQAKADRVSRFGQVLKRAAVEHLHALAADYQQLGNVERVRALRKAARQARQETASK